MGKILKYGPPASVRVIIIEVIFDLKPFAEEKMTKRSKKLWSISK